MFRSRVLSPSFFDDLQNGKLSPILERVKQDHTLMLAIREGYINIYYRGGNIVRIEELNNGSYNAFFDEDYNKSGCLMPTAPSIINSRDDAIPWVRAFPHLKEVMDHYFSGNNKPEREFQQLVARENNCSTISNETEYFISDIELNDSEIGARFDMLAVRWLANQRRNGINCRAALIEMKYGDNALYGKSGMIEHLSDMEKFIQSDKYPFLIDMMNSQFNQLHQLELLKFNRSENGTDIRIDPEKKPEVIFILANHNPRSTLLHSIIDKNDFEEKSLSEHFDLKFFISSFAGYGLHKDCLLPLNEFISRCRQASSKKKTAQSTTGYSVHLLTK